jgi:hypothetical protein
METYLVRLKPHDPRRGFVLRRYTFRGIKFHDERGWYKVDKTVGDYLRRVRQVPDDEHAPLAFDVCTEDEAKSLDAREKEAAADRKNATDDIKVSVARGTNAVTTKDLSDGAPTDDRGRRAKKG